MHAIAFRLSAVLLACSVLMSTYARAQTTAGTGARNYELAPDDVVEVKVFQEDDLTTRARISRDGSITFPLIGSVVIGGKTAQEAGELIRSRLEKRFLVNPQVTVTVSEHARKLFTVLGAVQRPGTYQFSDRDPLNVLQAIGLAGGYTDFGDPTKVTLKRIVNSKQSIFTLDAKRMARDPQTKQFTIQPGDMITVREKLF